MDMRPLVRLSFLDFIDSRKRYVSPFIPKMSQRCVSRPRRAAVLDDLPKAFLMPAGEVHGKGCAIDNSSYRGINRGVDTLSASKHLRRLCDFGLLQKKGQGSGTYYVPTEMLLVHWNEVVTREAVARPSEFEGKPSEFASVRSEASRNNLVLPADLAGELQKLGMRAKAGAVRDVIRKLCDWSDLTLPELARLLGRNEVYLRQRFVSPMVKEGFLPFTIPEEPNHPRQQYRSVPRSQSSG